MREIKFRLRIGDKIVGYEKWYPGYANKTFTNTAEPKWLYGKDGMVFSPRYISHKQKDQFTGLKDKNGKEIYEGDILMFPDTESDYADVGIGEVKVAETPVNSFCTVTFDKGCFGINVHEGEFYRFEKGFHSFSDVDDDWGEEFKKSFEIIGNIYENPDLLK